MNENTYTFTPQERSYFERLQAAFNSGLSSGIQMIITQKDLPGQWRLSQSGLGIERVDQQQQTAAVATTA